MRAGETKRRTAFPVYAAGFLILLLAFLFLFFCSEEERLIRYPKEDVRIVSGDDFSSLQTEGPPIEKEAFGVFSLKKGESYAFNLGEADGIRETAVIAEELNCSGIPAVLLFGQESGGLPVFLTKGWNSFQVQGKTGEMKLMLFPRYESTIHLEKLVWIREGSRRIFPWNALIISAAGYWILAAGTKIRFTLTWRKKAGILFFWFLLYMMQLRNTWYYFDDYGYLSLAYRQLTENRGISYGLPEILGFLRAHYCNWGGRVTAFFLEIMAGRSLVLLRMLSGLILAGLSYEYLRLWHPRGEPVSITGGEVCLPVLLWGFLDLAVLRDSAWWYTASVLYLWPVCGLLLGIRLFRENLKEEGSFLRKAASLIIVFFSASAQEQVSAAALLLTSFHFSAWLFRRKTAGREEALTCGGRFYAYAFLVTAFAGSLLLFAAPGNYKRLGLGERNSAAENGILVLRMLLADRLRCFVFLFLISAGCAAWQLGIRAEKTVFLHLIAGSVFFLAALGMFAGNAGLLSVYQAALRAVRRENLNSIGERILGILLLAAFLEIAFLMLLLNRRMVCMTAGALASLGCILPAPQAAGRMLLPAALLFLPVLGCVLENTIFGKRALRIGEGGRQPESVGKTPAASQTVLFLWVSAALSGLLIPSAVMNCDRILEGYFRNSSSEEYNREALEDYENRRDENALVELKKHWDDDYGNFMPYMEGCRWIEEYMKAMYNLPENAVFRWEEEEIYEDWNEEKHKENMDDHRSGGNSASDVGKRVPGRGKRSIPKGGGGT